MWELIGFLECSAYSFIPSNSVKAWIQDNPRVAGLLVREMLWTLLAVPVPLAFLPLTTCENGTPLFVYLLWLPLFLRVRCVEIFATRHFVFKASTDTTVYEALEAPDQDDRERSESPRVERERERERQREDH
eukprot:TRINITY_DN20581_c0_g1_i2.p1 TRINITY_DN20581_c0_g1~~TRINITY_DN20581_c0_g1_i2.p1  ORF type:complete len:155 (+),score=4.29 TRINITY_DN20581_c0_g1_i2:71-466(+)